MFILLTNSKMYYSKSNTKIRFKLNSQISYSKNTSTIAFTSKTHLGKHSLQTRSAVWELECEWMGGTTSWLALKYLKKQILLRLLIMHLTITFKMDQHLIGGFHISFEETDSLN